MDASVLDNRVKVPKFSFRPQKKRAFQAETASHRIRIATCFGCIFLFILVGCAVLMYYEGWDVIDAIFFCVVTLTTVGVCCVRLEGRLFVLYCDDARIRGSAPRYASRSRFHVLLHADGHRCRWVRDFHNCD